MTTAGETATATATATATETETSSPTVPAARLRETPEGAPAGDPAAAAACCGTPGTSPTRSTPALTRPPALALAQRHLALRLRPRGRRGSRAAGTACATPGRRPAGAGDGPANLGTSMLTAQGVADPFVARITVPFPWESRLSGVGDTSYKGVAWYQRELAAPPEWAEPGTGAGPGACGAATSASGPWTGTPRCGSTGASSPSTTGATPPSPSTSPATCAPGARPP